MLFYSVYLTHTHFAWYETEGTLPLLKQKPCTKSQASTIREHVHEREILDIQCLTSNNFDLQMGHTKPAAQLTSPCLGAAWEEFSPWFSRESLFLQALQWSLKYLEVVEVFERSVTVVLADMV